MTLVDWSTYQNRGTVVLDPSSLSRSDARRAYNEWIESKPYRIDLLCRFLARNGVVLGTSDASVQELNNWYVEHVTSKALLRPDDSWVLADRWYSVSDDIAAFLGDLMVERNPGLYWNLFTPSSKRSFSYHQPVIKGYTLGSHVVDDDLCVSPRAIVVAVGHNVVLGHRERVITEFVESLASSSKLVTG